MHATNSLKVRLSARTGESKFSRANSFMASLCSTFVRKGICVVKYCSSCDFLAVKMVFSCLVQTILRLGHFSFGPCDAVECV